MLLGLVLLSCELPADGNPEDNNSDGYKIIFNANGGEGSMTSLIFNPTEQVQLTKNSGAISREDYIFIIWNDRADGNGTEYRQEAWVDPQDSDLTLYAQWYEDNVYNLRDIGPGGGRIFYIAFDANTYFTTYPKYRYLEVAPLVTEAEKAWGVLENIWTANTLGAGFENTNAILENSNNNDGEYAAHYCKNLETWYLGKKIDDWYLPNRLELKYMYINLFDGYPNTELASFKPTLVETVGDDDIITRYSYWSSFQRGSANAEDAKSDFKYAYVIAFDNAEDGLTSDQVNPQIKSSTILVRPMRRF